MRLFPLRLFHGNILNFASAMTKLHTLEPESVKFIHKGEIIIFSFLFYLEIFVFIHICYN